MGDSEMSGKREVDYVEVDIFDELNHLQNEARALSGMFLDSVFGEEFVDKFNVLNVFLRDDGRVEISFVPNDSEVEDRISVIGRSLVGSAGVDVLSLREPIVIAVDRGAFNLKVKESLSGEKEVPVVVDEVRDAAMYEVDEDDFKIPGGKFRKKLDEV